MVRQRMLMPGLTLFKILFTFKREDAKPFLKCLDLYKKRLCKGCTKGK